MRRVPPAPRNEPLMKNQFSEESPLVQRFLTAVRAGQPSTGHDVAAQLFPTHMPFSAPTRAEQILTKLARLGWLENVDVLGRDPTPNGYVLSPEGVRVLAELERAS
jgi:hypothetical protein